METIAPLLEIIRTLRGENGCEWDRKQTPLSMWKCLAEEMYELEEALVNDDMDNIIEELGDVLFQILFILEIYIKKQQFDFSSVVNQVAQKMIRRHPHVYGTSKVDTEADLLNQWDAIKAREKKDAGQTVHNSVLDRIPRGMPGLMRALTVSKSAVKAGFDWESLEQVVDTLRSEIKEFETARAQGDADETMMEVGDVLFTMVNVARFSGFNPETALYRSTVKFEGRFRAMEAALQKKQLDLKTMTPEEKASHWEEAKKNYDR